MKIKIAAIAFGIIIATLPSNGICALKPWKIKYDPVLMDAIADRFATEYEFGATETIVALYGLDPDLLNPDELEAAKEWKRRLLQHEVEERRHFENEDNTLHTGAPFHRKRSTSANITLEEVIKIIADNGQFHWTRNGKAIVAEHSEPVKKDGAAVSVKRLSKKGRVVGRRPNKGVHAVFKFTAAGDELTSDFGGIWLK
jgi:hypothetical protein